MKPLTSGEMAKRADVHAETIRYYEREELLPIPERTESGYRQYPPEAIQRVQFIKRAQALGFTLKEVKELLALQHASADTAREVQAMTQHKLALINDKIRTLEAMKAALNSLLESCPGEHGKLSECPIIHCLEGLESTGPESTEKESTCCHKD
jgi:Hg(II)-responsive transcriptional regulator